MVDWIRSNRDRLGDPDAANRIRNELRRLLIGADLDADLAAAAASVRENVSWSAVIISATPTVFVNGVRLINPDTAVIDWAIRLELARLSK